MDGGREPCGAPNRLMASKHEQRLQGNTARESVADGSHTASMMRPRTVPTGFHPSVAAHQTPPAEAAGKLFF